MPSGINNNPHTELESLEAQHLALSNELKTAQNTLAIARRELSADVRHLEPATASQARVSAIEGALQALTGDITAKRAEVEDYDVIQATTARRARIAEIERERDACANDFNDARAEASEALNEPLNRMRQALETRASLEREAEKLLRDEGSNVSAHRATARDFTRTTVEHAEAVDVAFNVSANRIEHARRKTEVAEMSRARSERDAQAERTRRERAQHEREARDAQAERIEAWRTGAAA
jgi:chromosome segregation ATPase